MSNCRSQRRNYFVLFALMLLLPVVSAFAVNNTFNLTVEDNLGNPVNNATVYAWDKNNTTQISGQTATNGTVQLVLPGLVNTSGSLTDPKPNVGFAVFPDNVGQSTDLAYAVSDIVFYNVFNVDAIAPAHTIKVNPGCLVHIKPQINDGTATVPGLKSGMRIYYPGVPGYVRSEFVSNTQINGTTPSFDIYWPFKSHLNAEVYGDGNWQNWQVQNFYSFMNQGIQVAEEATLDFDIIHARKQKAAFRVNIVEPDPANPVLRKLHYGNNLTVSYQGNTDGTPVDLYFPMGHYNFNLALVNNDGSVANSYNFGTSGPPPALFSNVDLVDPTTVVERTHVITGGVSLTVNLELGNAPADGDETVLGNSRIEILKKVNTYGFDQWMPYQSTPNNLGTDGVVNSTLASANLWLRLSNGFYKIRIFDDNYAPGVIDNLGAMPKSFSYLTTPEFEITGAETSQSAQTEVINLPQTAAIVAPLTISNAPANGQTDYAPIVAYLNGGSLTQGSQWVWNSGSVFVPFARVDKPIIIRLDYDGDTTDSVSPIAYKVFAPIQATAGQTTAHPLAFDYNNFVNVTINLMVGVGGPAFQGTAKMVMSPVVPGTEISGQAAMSNGYGFLDEIFYANDQKQLTFMAEIGSKFSLDVKEDYPFALEGFVPLHQNVLIPGTHTPGTSFLHDAAVNENPSFAGVIQVNGTPIDPGSAVLVKIQSIIEGDFNNPDYFSFERQGQVMGSLFKVAGVNPGRYKVALNLDNVDTNAYPINYTQQTMPMIVREVTVTENSTALQPAVPFNLNTAVIGYAKGKIVDDTGAGVAGLQVAIHRKGFSSKDTFEPYFMRGEAVFFCTTDAQGNLITAASPTSSPAPDLIPLEAGEYEAFVEGIAVAPTSFTYDFGEMHMAQPTLRFNILPNNQVTPVLGEVMRKFPLTGVISESGNPVPFVSFQILGTNGEAMGYGYTNESGAYEVYGGVAPGPVQVGLIVEDGPDRRFYLKQYNMMADQANVFNMNLDPSTLSLIPMVTKDSSGANLPHASGDLFMFSDPVQNFRAPHWYLTWIESDDLGNMNLSVPNFTPEQAGFAYAFRGMTKWESVTVKDETGADKMINQTYAPPPMTVLPLDSTEPVVLTWKTPAVVKIDVTNVPAERASRYIGVLMTEKMFAEGLNAANIHQTPTTGGGEAERPFFAPLLNGSFVFENIVPGNKYVFAVYESFDPVFADELQWAYEFSWRAIFRHVSAPFAVDANLVRAEALRNLGALTVGCTQDPTLIMSAKDVRIGFTSDPANTTGKPGWPVVMDQYPDPNEPGIAFPIMVPANYALRVAYVPDGNSRYLKRVYENVIVETTGKALDVQLKELKSISGTFVSSGMPMNGQILLIPDGADATNPDFKPIRINAVEGAYNSFLAPGHYIGYALPIIGAPQLIDVLMVPDTDLTLDITFATGQMVFGRVVGPNSTPIFDASVAVMRKESARSEMIDGQDFLPYPAFQGSNEIRCGPDGGFFFEVEDGVDYYLQAIVPVGFTPGAPVKVSMAGTLANEVLITVGEGGKIIGSANVPVRVEAKPAGQNALMEQFSQMSMIQTEAYVPNTNGRFEFTLYGLDPAIPYEITFWPMESGKAMKKLTNIMVSSDPTTSPLNVDLGDGFKVVGQLVDMDGNPINAKDVPVNLAMTLPMEILPVTAANAKFPIKQSTEVPDPANFSLEDAVLQGQWTRTNQYGQFEFSGVPQFLVAFVKTEDGFSYENVDYGRARTENFPAEFATVSVMEVEVKVPVAGKIVGRLINETGQPITAGSISAGFGESWADGKIDSEGNFELVGLAPGANYMVQIDQIPGRVVVFRMGVLVESGQTVDLGPILVAKAVPVTGVIGNIAAVIQHAFQYGVPEGMGLSIVALDGNRNITDEEILRGTFMKYIVGEDELFFDPMNPPTADMPFEVYSASGKANLGLVLHSEDQSGARTMVTWGWQPGLSIPTQEQLGIDSYALGATIPCPTAFGTIEGSLKHSVDLTARFNPEDAVVALFPVEKVGTATDYTLKTMPFPTAYTSPIDGRWFIRNVPAGTYRIKVITKKYGSQFFGKIITIGSTIVKEELALGTSVKRVFGKIVVKGTTTPVASAKVNMFLRQLATSTDSTGNFSFYLPVGEHILAQLEILKPGFEATRVLEFTGVATQGVRLENDLDLGTIEFSNAVGRFEAVVKSADGNQPLIGAEVALVYKESATSNVWTIGETIASDESGRVQFSTVPLGKDVTFRARAFYHTPFIYTLTAANNTGAVSDVITLQKANPKVFYTGFITPVEGDATKLTVNGLFDFNQPVYQNRLGLTIATVDRLSEATPVDLLGGRLTSMKFNNTIPNADEVLATISYDVAANSTMVGIGMFNLVGGGQFSKEFEVNPLDPNGFNAYQTDSLGNNLPVGLKVPQGYLDPSINSFNILVATATAGDSVLEGTTTPPEFAGPSFEFTFGGGSFGAGTQHEGLFDITIKYDPGTALEPRWYDATNKRWSKVGIIADSIQYDSPQAGYVTFKVSHLTKFAVLKNVAGAASGLRCDFTGDSTIDDKDLAGLIARNQLSNAGVAADQLTAANINTVAAGLLTSQTFTVGVAPSASLDDLNGDGKLDDNDLAFLIGWLQLKNAGLTTTQITETAVKTVSTGLLGSLSGSLSKFPGETVSR